MSIYKNNRKIPVLKIYIKVKSYGYSKTEGIVQFVLSASGYKPHGYSTGIKVERSRFDPKTLTVTDEPVKTLSLQQLKLRLNETFFLLQHKGASVPLKELPSLAIKGFIQTLDQTTTIRVLTRDYTQQYQANEGISIKRHTVNKYTRFEEILLDFLSEVRKNIDLSVKDVKKTDARLLLDFCRQRYQHDHNTAARNVSILKRVLQQAMDSGLIDRNPLERYTERREKRVKFALTEAEVYRIDQLPLQEPTTAIVRDKFVFACYTGLSHGDLDELHINDIITLPNGKRAIKKTRNKNGQPFIVPLLPPAERILGRYALERLGLCFPQFTQQFENRTIKIITGFCGISYPVKFKDARSTFGSMLHTLGVPTSALQIAMGHENPSTTERYYLTKQTEAVFGKFDFLYHHFNENHIN